MNRRKAISRIVLAGIGGGLAFGGYKWNDWNKTPDIAWLGQRKQLLAALAATIIPVTDTPGARQCGVDDFIFIMIRDCTDRRSQNKFIDGLKELEAHCRSAYDKNYKDCSEKEQHDCLALFAKKAKPINALVGKAENKYLGSPFFTTLKQYTIQGYCSSETGATMGLAYVAIPGSYQGCIPLQPGQRAWATK